MRRKSWLSGSIVTWAIAAIAGITALCFRPAQSDLKSSSLISPPFDKHDHRGSRIIPFWDKSGSSSITQQFIREFNNLLYYGDAEAAGGTERSIQRRIRKHKLEAERSLLFTLFTLRTGSPVTVASVLFRVSSLVGTRCLTTWVNFFGARARRMFVYPRRRKLWKTHLIRSSGVVCKRLSWFSMELKSRPSGTGMQTLPTPLVFARVSL